MPAHFPLHTHYSNRTEALVDGLAEVLAHPCGGPFAKETIVVQGRGMAAYLTQQLAARLGVWANPNFCFPRRYIELCQQAVLGAGAQTPVTEDQLTWLVLAEFEHGLHGPEFQVLTRYLDKDAQGLKRFQLARRLGTLFDRYITYRPEMIRAFSSGHDVGLPDTQQWQALLWRRLEARLTGAQGAAVEPLWHQSAAELTQRPPELPARVCLFGISSLPPQYLRVVARASRWVQTHVFVFSPSDKDWWNSATRSEWARFVAAGENPDLHYVDLGHPLVSSCGTVGADFRRVMADTCEALGVDETVDERFEQPGGSSCLARLQADIFHLRRKQDLVTLATAQPTPVAKASAGARKSRGKPAAETTAVQMALPFAAPLLAPEPQPGPASATPVETCDDSIGIHACHSPMREVEVLKDQLLALLTRKADPVQPHEVVVMMADVETYAPFVEAVFGVEAKSPTFIPYRIADRKLRADSPVVDAFFRALDLVGTRVSAPTVMDLLAASAIESRLGIAAGELDRLTEWVLASGIRWGIDAEHRAMHDQPADVQNTWRFGVDRLLLGYAMPAEGAATFAGVLPYDEIEGKAAAELGTFVDYLERLFRHLGQLRAPRTMPRWRTDLLALLEDLVGQGEGADWEHQHLRQGLAGLESEAAAAGFDGEVDLAVVRQWLEERVEAALPERGFLAGGVTFCAMIPMRSIPFRVVCLLGLNDGVFPRFSTSPEFDLVARGPKGPQPGDRDRRLDDRYLFLETLCAAREKLIITYTGQSVRDNAIRPPSVLLSELLDVVTRRSRQGTSEPAQVAAVEAELVLRHPLQGFSRRYFDGGDDRLFSFANGFRVAAAQLQQELRDPPPFVDAPLVLVPREVQVSLDDLDRFWRDPLRFFLQRCVRVDFNGGEEDMPNREPTWLGPLEVHHVGSLLMQALQDDAEETRLRAFDLVRAAGVLPLGTLGQVYLENLWREAEAIARVARHLRRVARPPHNFDLLVGPGMRLVGNLDGLWEAGIVRPQFGQVRARHQMAAWLRHLVLCAIRPASVALQTTALGRQDGEAPQVYQWAEVKDPKQLLLQLIQGFEVGQAAPLAFLPEASLPFVDDGGRSSRSEEEALRKASVAYNAHARFAAHWQRSLPEGGPPFEHLVTTGPDFATLARMVMGPLLQHRTTLQGDPT